MSETPTSTTATAMETPPNEFIYLEEEDEDNILLSQSELLSHEEVIKRRAKRLKQLAKVYKHSYWCMMEDLRLKYRKYYWEFGKSPYDETDKNCTKNNNNNNNQNNNNNNGEGELGFGGDSGRCAVHGCKSKAMALTKFCHGHILSDSKQKLYMGCNYVIKSSQAGPILCGKPILKCTVPTLCAPHFQKAEKHVARALKKAGLIGSSTNKLAPKFHVLIAEYVRQIQSNRRAIDKEIRENSEIKEEEISI
uniref:INO80 complex subunit D-like n=1 Tax=Erigeron canadensis TaxID=72917 RepID=UPI001CB95CCB|nr:INO80 complex subunit D-like [Erigeron canadensis]